MYKHLIKNFKAISSDDLNIVTNRSIELIKLNKKRKKIEKLILEEIDFN